MTAKIIILAAHRPGTSPIEQARADPVVFARQGMPRGLKLTLWQENELRRRAVSRIRIPTD